MSDNTIHDDAPRGLRSIVRNWWDGRHNHAPEEPEAEYDGDESDEGEPARENRHSFRDEAAPRPVIQIATSRKSAITVVKAASIEDARKAADRLKLDTPQIVNLTGATTQNAEKLLDFLNGVTYALGGTVERVAEGTYLFTPRNVMVQSAEPEAPTRVYPQRPGA